jgi:hypothetical protein
MPRFEFEKAITCFDAWVFVSALFEPVFPWGKSPLHSLLQWPMRPLTAFCEEDRCGVDFPVFFWAAWGLITFVLVCNPWCGILAFCEDYEKVRMQDSPRGQPELCVLRPSVGRDYFCLVLRVQVTTAISGCVIDCEHEPHQAYNLSWPRQK